MLNLIRQLTRLSPFLEGCHNISPISLTNLSFKLLVMAHTLSHQHAYLLSDKKTHSSVFSRFFAWARRQDEKNHVGWVGASVMTMAGVLFPATMAFILLNGAEFSLIIAAMSALVLVVVTNLAALPVKYTLPFLLLGTLTDVVVIVASFLMK
jgi:hypothetical protein